MKQESDVRNQESVEEKTQFANPEEAKSKLRLAQNTLPPLVPGAAASEVPRKARDDKKEALWERALRLIEQSSSIDFEKPLEWGQWCRLVSRAGLDGDVEQMDLLEVNLCTYAGRADV